jgi:hypothetical protein
MVLALIIILLAILAVVVFLEPVRITFLLDTDRLDMHAIARWAPFAALEARIIDYRLFVTVRLFGKKIVARYMKKDGNKKPRASHFEALALSGTTVKISCGLSEPHLTGIFCAAADFAGALIRDVGIELEPEFFPDREFLHLEAATSLNIGRTIIRLIKASILRRRNNYGSTA